MSSSQASATPGPGSCGEREGFAQPEGTPSESRITPAIHNAGRPPLVTTAASRAPSRDSDIAAICVASGQAPVMSIRSPPLLNAARAAGVSRGTLHV